MSFDKFTYNSRAIYATKGGNFNKVSSKFVSTSNSTIPKHSLSLVCKVCSLTRVLFNIEAHNFAWDEDLKKKIDEEALTFGDVRTFCFLAVGFFGRAKR